MEKLGMELPETMKCATCAEAVIYSSADVVNVFCKELHREVFDQYEPKKHIRACSSAKPTPPKDEEEGGQNG